MRRLKSSAQRTVSLRRNITLIAIPETPIRQRRWLWSTKHTEYCQRRGFAFNMTDYLIRSSNHYHFTRLPSPRLIRIVLESTLHSLTCLKIRILNTYLAHSPST
jgi:hypothetical protein